MKGEDLRAFRQKHGLSQYQLAVRLGVSPSAVWLWEKNRRPISRILALALETLAREFEEKKEAQ